MTVIQNVLVRRWRVKLFSLFVLTSLLIVYFKFYFRANYCTGSLICDSLPSLLASASLIFFLSAISKQLSTKKLYAQVIFGFCMVTLYEIAQLYDQAVTFDPMDLLFNYVGLTIAFVWIRFGFVKKASV